LTLLPKDCHGSQGPQRSYLGIREEIFKRRSCTYSSGQGGGDLREKEEQAQTGYVFLANTIPKEKAVDI